MHYIGTANTMCCVAEAMGMCPPGSVTVPATHADRLRAAQESGRQIVELLRKGITAHAIINKKGIENAIRVSTAIGGSTNVALHIPAIGYEADCEVIMDLFEELCRSTPHIAKMKPAAAPNVPDFHHYQAQIRVEAIGGQIVENLQAALEQFGSICGGLEGE